MPVCIRAQAQPVTITFTALGKDKRSFTGLRKEDIRVLDEGVPQEVIKLERQTDRPLAVVIMIDASISQEGTLTVAKRSARAFLDSIIRPEKDLAAVVSFASEATLEQGLTADMERLRTRIENIWLDTAGGGAAITPPAVKSPPDARQLIYSTAVWDAVWVASSDIFGQDTSHMRRAIILISDGQDTSSRKKMTEAIEQAIQAQVSIFAIGAGSEDYGIDKETLRKMSERTGGRAFFPGKNSELSPILAEMAEELRSQYLITYSPANVKKRGRMSKVKIEVVNPELRKQDLRISYQQGYTR